MTALPQTSYQPVGQPRSAPRPSTSPHFAELDGLRGVAILLVFVFHYVSLGNSRGFVSRIVQVILSNLWFGVDIFFVLSGFLITLILLDARGARSYFTTFFARRFLRIFPIYYGVLTVIFLLLPLAGVPLDRSLQQSQVWLWTFTSNIKIALAGSHEPFMDPHVQLHHFWSLAVEEQFYLFWPLLVACTSRRGLAFACVFCIVTSPLLRLGLVLTHAPYLAIYSLTPCRLDALAAGALLAVAYRNGHLDTRAARSVGVAMTLSLLALAGFILAPRISPHAQPVLNVLGFSVLACVGASLVAGCLCLAPSNPFRRLMRTRILRGLGKYSYGLYIYHLVLFPAIDLVASTKILQRVLGLPYIAAGLLHLVAAGVICFAIAFASWQLVEKPVLSLKRFFPYHRPASPS